MLPSGELRDCAIRPACPLKGLYFSPKRNHPLKIGEIVWLDNASE